MTDAWFFSNQWRHAVFFRDAVRWAIDDGIEFEVQTGYCFDAGNGPPILYPCHEPKAQRKQRFQIVDPQLAFNSAGERWEFIVYLDAWVWGVVRKNHKPDLLNMFFSPVLKVSLFGLAVSCLCPRFTKDSPGWVQFMRGWEA